MIEMVSKVYCALEWRPDKKQYWASVDDVDYVQYPIEAKDGDFDLVKAIICTERLCNGPQLKKKFELAAVGAAFREGK